jgi:hypothetical protein
MHLRRQSMAVVFQPPSAVYGCSRGRSWSSIS